MHARPAQYCPEEGTSSAAPDTSNHPCPAGQYCEQATRLPVDCPRGTVNSATGGTGLASCLSCPAGSFCLAGSSGITGLCAPGYYCLAGSHGNTSVAGHA